ncbi:MAG: NAD-dependent epimerase/dehydratase family protein [Verrucomicrobia bacterium]|nr:NAD-dependent epimerase/dehydratase family protein [Verrucomicrobiota bacterium]
MIDRDDLIVIAGAGGFIGGHLAANLRAEGFKRLRAVDRKPVSEWLQRFDDLDNQVLDLRELPACRSAVQDAKWIYNLASDMGGMGFIELNKAACMLSVLINTHLLVAAREAGAERFFFASSACVYNADKQRDPKVTALKEEDAYPALPEDGYGWEKLFGERMCRHFREDYRLQTRMVRYHNVYGPHGTYAGGREKAPAAICRKVIEAKLSGRHEIEIWGDGHQTRSFMYIDDCIHGSRMVMAGDFVDPINVGSNELVSINQLVDIVEGIAGIRLERRYNLSAPKGVNGRNSDNTLLKRVFGWEPSIRLRDGLTSTYQWIYDQVVAKTALRSAGGVNISGPHLPGESLSFIQGGKYCA